MNNKLTNGVISEKLSGKPENTNHGIVKSKLKYTPSTSFVSFLIQNNLKTNRQPLELFETPCILVIF